MSPESLAVDLRHDWHVHSRFSDGSGTLEENVEAAERRGLTLLACVDHVRADTDWVPRLVEAVRGLQPSTRVRLQIGVEAKLLDTTGALDLPDTASLVGVDRVVVADHQVPTPDGPVPPDEVQAALEEGTLDPQVVAGWLVQATVRALERHPRAHVAHLFSLLPKLGLDEGVVGSERVADLVRAAAATGAVVEVSERWRTPSQGMARAFARAGVRVVAATDAHTPDAVGWYRYCREVTRAPRGRAAPGRRGRPTWRPLSTHRS